MWPISLPEPAADPEPDPTPEASASSSAAAPALAKLLPSLSGTLSPLVEDLDHPGETLEFAEFQAMVAAFRRPDATFALLSQYALGGNWPLACAALIVLGGHPDRQGLRDQVLGRLEGIRPFVGSFSIGRYGASLYSVVIIVAAAAALAGMLALLRGTRFGLILRATMQNPRMSAALGVSPSTIYMATFALGSALAGLAGGVLAPISGVSPAMGGAYIARAFITVLGGGPAISTGTGLAAFLFGFINELVSFQTTPIVGDVALLVAAVLLIRVLPQGITGRFLRRSL